MTELPQDLIREVQKHTGAPWWNGQAYAEHLGYPQAINKAAAELDAYIAELRAAKNYEVADRLRTIRQTLKVQP